ncbi:putative defensin-like protein 244 [Neltuma alba]|uniref:putative defensin-like protein 244 n=1 Tax=Neltuma alba TaxID=207710 RepID=UPI0010A37EA8|nr:putative defensin-like protein 244 [Prosopis alba]
MKLGLIFSLFVVLVSVISLHAQAQGGGNLCPKEMTLDGTCGGTKGGYGCALEFLAQYGASAMPQHCTCTDLHQQKRLCKCDIVCQYNKLYL